jgi:hypothetical protein
MVRGSGYFTGLPSVEEENEAEEVNAAAIYEA